MYQLKTELPIELQNIDEQYASIPTQHSAHMSEQAIVWKIVKTASAEKCIAFLRGLPSEALTQDVRDAIDERFPPEHEQRGNALEAIQKRKAYVKKGRKRKRLEEE